MSIQETTMGYNNQLLYFATFSIVRMQHVSVDKNPSKQQLLYIIYHDFDLFFTLFSISILKTLKASKASSLERSK